MVTFKLRLVAYFVLLTLLPLGAAYWGFHSLAGRSETRSADARLQAGLRATLGAYEDRVLALDGAAARLARDEALQEALRTRDRTVLASFVAADPNLEIRAGSLRLGAQPSGAVARTVGVVSGTRVLGDVTLWLSLDRRLLEHVAQRSGLEPSDRLVLLRHGRVVTGPADLVGAPVAEQAGEPAVETVHGTRYRVLSAPTLDQPRGAAFAVLTPQSAIDAAASRSERTLLLALLGSLALAGVVGYALSRSIVGTLGRLASAAEAIARGNLRERVPVRGRDEFSQVSRAFNEMAAQLEARLVELDEERRRLGRATQRLGDALAATHDVDQLLAVVVETAVEATRAYGGVVLAPNGSERARIGDPDSGLNTLELPLRAGRRTFGTLRLAGPAFGDDEREAAAGLVAQAVVALENARLHRIVERQALVDGLTGLANRRSCEEALRAELHRAERFGDELAVVLADLDGFKALNDRYGHPFGDLVLREFGRRLRETIREIDIAGRWGGEEFCVVLPGTDEAGGARVAERARASLEQVPMTAPDGTSVTVTASFGVAALAERPGGERALVDAADAALYEAKRAGKNRVARAAQGVVRR